MVWMKRAAVVIAVLLSPGCADECEPVGGIRALDDTEAPCGDFADIDLSGCDPASLAQLNYSGVWHVLSEVPTTSTDQKAAAAHDEQLHSNETFTSALSLLAPRAVFRGREVADQELSCKVAYVSTRYTTQNSGRVRYSYAGCRATGPGRLEGRYQVCVNEELRFGGTFEAVRVERPNGEQESENLELVAELPLEGRTADVYVANGHAFVSRFYGGVSVVDLSVPGNPQVVATVGADEDYWNDAWVKDNVLFMSGAERGLVYYDVTVPSAPTSLGEWPGPDQAAVNVHTTFIDGNILYAVSPRLVAVPRDARTVGEVIVFDVTSAREPRFLSRFTSPSATTWDHWPHDAFALNNRLYINYWGLGLVVADTSNPSNLVELGRFTWPNASSHASAAGVFGDKVIAFEGGEDWNAHLRVLDVTNPADITQLSAFQIRPEVSIHNFILKGDKLYVAHYQDGVRVLDVSNPAAPRQIAYYNTFREPDPGHGESFYDGAIGMRVPGDGFVYVADVVRGLLIFRELP
jgi:hypothetical protein